MSPFNRPILTDINTKLTRTRNTNEIAQISTTRQRTKARRFKLISIVIFHLLQIDTLKKMMKKISFR